MINIDQQHQVHGVRGQLGIGDVAHHGNYVADSGLGGVLAKPVEHLRLQIVGVHLARGTHALGHTQAHVADARADVGHHHAGLQVQRIQSFFGLLFGFALGPDQPVGTVHSHDAGDLAPA